MLVARKDEAFTLKWRRGDEIHEARVQRDFFEKEDRYGQQIAEYTFGAQGSISQVPGEKGTACTWCGDCLPRCPEGLDIPALLWDAQGRLFARSTQQVIDFAG